MKHRILCVLLAITITVTLLPSTAFAEEAFLPAEVPAAEETIAEPEPDPEGAEYTTAEEAPSLEESLPVPEADSETTEPLECDVTDEAAYWSELDKSAASIVIPEGVTTVPDRAFINCTELTSVTLPESMTSIGSEAFKNCTALATINLPNTITEIGTNAFESCESLTRIRIPSGVTRIPSGAFLDCSALSDVTIPAGVTHFDTLCFARCTSLTQIILPEGIDTIEPYAFQQTGLTSIVIPDTTYYVQSYAFSDCRNLTRAYFPKTVVCADEGVFWHSPNVIICTNLTGGEQRPREWDNTWHLYTSSKSLPVVYGQTGLEIYIPKPTGIKTANAPEGVKVSWKASAGATIYYVYRRTNPTDDWSRVGESTTTSFIDTRVVSGRTYTYTVKAASVISSSYNKTGVSILHLSRPTTSAEIVTEGIALRWSAVKGAGGYYVYRSLDGKNYEKIKTLRTADTLTYTDTNRTNGQKCYYKVIAYQKVDGTVIKSSASYPLACYWLRTPVISTAINNGTGKVSIEWDRNRSANGYEVKYVTGNTAKILRITGNTASGIVLSGLDQDSTCRVYIRSYKTKGTTYYSSWSSGKSIRISN